MPKQPRYDALIGSIFAKHYRQGIDSFEFGREELQKTAAKLRIVLPKNLGDVIYSFRYRKNMPASIHATQIEGREWVIEPAGRAKYRFCLVGQNRITPNAILDAIKIPDATPEIIAANALNDEQSLLAKVRYNRLIDVFLGVTTYSLQSHLRTTVKGMGQIEIDEVYVGVGKTGQQYVIPVQAKGGADRLALIQTKQDLAYCAERFPALTCRAVSAQFIDDEERTIALFELALRNGEVRQLEERHYQLVPAEAITEKDLRAYAAPRD